MPQSQTNLQCKLKASKGTHWSEASASRSEAAYLDPWPWKHMPEVSRPLSFGRLVCSSYNGSTDVWFSYLMEGLQVLQGLLGSQSQRGLQTGGQLADTSQEAGIQQRGAQQGRHLLLQQHRLEETQWVETDLPVSICQNKRGRSEMCSMDTD